MQDVKEIDDDHRLPDCRRSLRKRPVFRPYFCGPRVPSARSPPPPPPRSNRKSNDCAVTIIGRSPTCYYPGNASETLHAAEGYFFSFIFHFLRTAVARPAGGCTPRDPERSSTRILPTTAETFTCVHGSYETVPYAIQVYGLPVELYNFRFIGNARLFVSSIVVYPIVRLTRSGGERSSGRALKAEKRPSRPRSLPFTRRGGPTIIATARSQTYPTCRTLLFSRTPAVDCVLFDPRTNVTNLTRYFILSLSFACC